MLGTLSTLRKAPGAQAKDTSRGHEGIHRPKKSPTAKRSWGPQRRTSGRGQAFHSPGNANGSCCGLGSFMNRENVIAPGSPVSGATTLQVWRNKRQIRAENAGFWRNKRENLHVVHLLVSVAQSKICMALMPAISVPLVVLHWSGGTARQCWATHCVRWLV